jgi:hypothetical protein
MRLPEDCESHSRRIWVLYITLSPAETFVSDLLALPAEVGAALGYVVALLVAAANFFQCSLAAFHGFTSASVTVPTSANSAAM